ncbi:hypothetical protein TSTA_051970, partial [Talaromyces stipitatus ATCC 10500]
ASHNLANWVVSCDTKPEWELNDNKAINEVIRYLVEAINQAAEQATPTKQISIYSRVGYTSEMAKLKHHATESIDGFWRIARWVRNRGKPRATFTPTLHYNNT